MKLSSDTIFYIGYIPTGILGVMGFMKILRIDKLIRTIILLALIFASLGFVIHVEESDLGTGFAPAVFTTPLVYILLYATLRYLYKTLYKVEPTYNRSSWYDEEDKREQKWSDYFVHILPILLAFIFPLFFLSK